MKEDNMHESLEITEGLLKKYHDLNREKKEIEKKLNQMKKQLHHYFDETVGKEQKAEVKRGPYKAQRVIRSSVQYNDEKTIQKLEELNLQDFILVVKQPDTEKLEAAMKLDLVDQDAFADCKKQKHSQAITIKEENA
ncbi:hypothetical protein J416_12447 [Gracilibacillus halophilus YIM-C55.5]|uniref:Uncharacterized protein n=1 Tax=Gracilibacillus halophilus YIM-C55.5 TaxID=1308866 RepID=N4WA47_9BACI|nr:hypothetical protein [Gracilibacillus halophilus]ENH96129.1 hypothetical protein J416_12447 [Gracilibacillus halophilus YIM-C55.5]